MRAAERPLPGPGAPVYESFVRVRFNEVDSLGHVNNAVYLVYLEQAAIDHASAVGLGAERLANFGGAFVAYRHEIVYQRPAFSGDTLRVLTWLDDAQGARVTRHYLIIKDSEPSVVLISGRLHRGREVSELETLVAWASTEWVFINQQGRPKRIPPEVMLLFAEPAAPGIGPISQTA